MQKDYSKFDVMLYGENFRAGGGASRPAGRGGSLLLPAARAESGSGSWVGAGREAVPGPSPGLTDTQHQHLISHYNKLMDN